MRSRRSPQPPSWLSVIESASAGFTGTARLVRDDPVPATETDFRGAGHTLEAEVTPDQALFGHAPAGQVTLHGQTARPPERRTGPHEERFPPDSLRAVPYWDQAHPADRTPVLCLLADPPLVRSLLGPDDDLPRAVAIIWDWTQESADSADIERRLSSGDQSAVCYVAGFELAARTTTELPALVERFLLLPGRPGGAARGILALVHVRTGRLPDDEVVDLARRLLGVMTVERDPDALVGYLTWLDAHRGRIEQAAPGLTADIRVEATRAATRRFEGPDADAWGQEVARFSAALDADDSDDRP